MPVQWPMFVTEMARAGAKLGKKVAGVKIDKYKKYVPTNTLL
jgi:hypothetical protein